MKKNSILVDLDVVTVAMWKDAKARRDLALKFIRRVELKEFEVITPIPLIELIVSWKNKTLRENIEEFYFKESTIFLTNQDIDYKIKELGINDKEVLETLEKEGVKEEDALLVLITSIFKIDYLVTMSRKHLRNKEKVINKVLEKYNLSKIKIVGPDEI